MQNLSKAAPDRPVHQVAVVEPLIKRYLMVVVVTIVVAFPFMANWLTGQNTAETGPQSFLTVQEMNKVTIVQFYDQVVNGGDLTAIQTLTASPPIADELHRLVTQQSVAYYQIQYTLVDLLAEDDRVVVRWQASGIPHTSFQTHPPTGQSLTWQGTTFYQLMDGKIVAVWDWDGQE